MIIKKTIVPVLIPLFLLLFAAVFSVSAAWSGLPYNPGDTLNPECSPTDSNCLVKAPAVSGANRNITSLSGFVNSTATGNSYFTGGFVGIGTSTPSAKLTVINGSLLAWGTIGSNPFPGVIGTGFMWVPDKGALRAGHTDATAWASENIGMYSFAANVDNKAAGMAATALGYQNSASGNYSFVAGENSLSSGEVAIALGKNVTAGGMWSVAGGAYVTAAANKSIIFGSGVDDANRIVNNTENSLMFGFNSTIPTFFVGPGSGVGTIGKVGVGTANPTSILTISAQSGTSTMAIGSGSSASCFKVLDTDKNGFTYCTVLDGAMSCSQSDCSN